MKPTVPENSLPIHPEAFKKYSFADFLTVSDEMDLKDTQYFHPNNKSVCGFCNAADAKQVYCFSYGSLTGGTNEYAYQCPHCGKYTYCSKDWG